MSELWLREDICNFVDRAFDSGIVSRNPSDAEEHIAYRYAIKLAIDETRQAHTDALKIAREGLERIKNRKWDTMTQGCDAAVEAANIARDALAALGQSK
jgi:hypothetical protein